MNALLASTGAALCLAVAACGQPSTAEKAKQAEITGTPKPAQKSAPPPELVDGPAPVALPSRAAGPTRPEEPARAPRSDAETEAALAVVHRYYDFIAARNYREAWLLRSDRNTLSLADFTASLTSYRDYHATVGLPSGVEGAAGSLYIEVPVQLYGTTNSGKPFGSAGTLTLRRSNDVPGATAEQRSWHIYAG